MRYLKFGFPLVLLSTCLLAFTQARRLKAARLLVLMAAMLFAFSWVPVSWLSSWSLERGYPALSLPPADVQAIVVLGGGGLAPEVRQPYSLPSEGTVVRCRHAAWLYHNWKQVDILVSGPRYSTAPEGAPTSSDMKDLLRGWGVPENRIWFESEGRSTYEEAVAISRILKQRGVSKVALVTEAYHMRRAQGCFRKLGMQVVPAACGFRTAPPDFLLSYLLPSYQAIKCHEDVLREWAALVVYWLRNRI